MAGIETPEEYLTTEQFAEMFQVPTKTARLWIRDGSGPPAAKFGRHIRLRRSDIDQWAAGRFAAAAAAESTAGECTEERP